MNIHHFSDILIVDDSIVVRSVVRKLLTQLGYKRIDEAADGAEALKQISEKHFDLVISDWNMQPMSGYELLEQVRANEKWAKLRFVMMTANSSMDKVIQAKHAGVSCFIKKPFSAEDLKSKILQVGAEPQLVATA